MWIAVGHQTTAVTLGGEFSDTGHLRGSKPVLKSKTAQNMGRAVTAKTGLV